MTTPRSKRTRRIVLASGFLVGAIGGFLYWKFVGCLNGTCMIWSNPWIATGYGGVLGWLLAGILPFGLKKNEDAGETPSSGPDAVSKEV